MKYLLLLTILLSGCALNTSKDRLIVDNIRLESETTQLMFCYFSKAKEINKQTPISSLSVGQLDSWPDPNSIKPVFSELMMILKGI